MWQLQIHSIRASVWGQILPKHACVLNLHFQDSERLSYELRLMRLIRIDQKAHEAAHEKNQDQGS